MKKWALPLLLTVGAILIFLTFLKKSNQVVPRLGRQTVSSQENRFLVEIPKPLKSLESIDSGVSQDPNTPGDFDAFDAFLDYIITGNEIDPNKSKVKSYPLYEGNIYTGQEYFRIKNLGSGHERIIYNGDYETYLEDYEGKYPQGYILKLFEGSDKCIKTIKNLPDYFIITNFKGLAEKTIFERDYLEYVEENKEKYPWGYNVRRFKGNDLVEEIENDLMK